MQTRTRHSNSLRLQPTRTPPERDQHKRLSWNPSSWLIIVKHMHRYDQQLVEGLVEAIVMHEGVGVVGHAGEHAVPTACVQGATHVPLVERWMPKRPVAGRRLEKAEQVACKRSLSNCRR